ncbi:MAG: putative quinol monooxygenase [Pseudomonas sp.]|uniref:putative quinol monooxygenase n=1 Tax=Pseudomonas abieticivorans TaxID=2931382 RepID=UPI0020BFA45B|nr:putative quinol monooxygenase [Pseudomonas sp. PIA16]MDE1169186.1 putative quinol monooxygenase [Pseudomonas sp.]
MSEQHGFILKAKTKAHMADAFHDLFGGYVAASRSEPGCIEYHMLRDLQDPTLFVFYEIWASQADLDVHSALPHMAAFFERRMDYLERDFEIQRVEMLSPSSATPRPAAPSR